MKHVIMNPIIFLENDVHPNNIKLAKFGKKMGASITAVQNTLYADSKTLEKYLDFVAAYTKVPQWLPFFIRIRLIWLRKWIGHIWKYRTLKAGKSSYVLWRGCSGLRDSDRQTYLCNEQKKIFIKNGVPKYKLVYAPLFYEKLKKPLKKIITILIPSNNNGGVNRKKGTFITHSEQSARWLTLVIKIIKKYPGYKYILKFHFETKNFEKLKKIYSRLPNTTCLIDKKLTNWSTNQASIIIGLPPSFSTLLYQASVEYPWKQIISLDVGNEMFGDYFKGYKNIKVVKEI